MELEADGLGAEYMHKTGYDPQGRCWRSSACSRTRSSFQRVQARAGRQDRLATYHGLVCFSHPRNDQRLQNSHPQRRVNWIMDELRGRALNGAGRISGATWRAWSGERAYKATRAKKVATTTAKLAFTFERPRGLVSEVTADSQAVVARAPQGRWQNLPLTITPA